ncbi:aminopeptidase P N-terminal domain-containing protein [Flammeovirgaceae bacterium SG7u.111]|nr:aminopeptidase P N-terminal domain-containing protein [Flammeovirgaceae bacterium SG7u.132]WPO35298.1 aminopeptidase P N-terminal domain-containing protein [Flammeovirgaceae bacterium SG7u.111]
MKKLLTVLICCLPLWLLAQEYPTDHLPKDFHKKKREQIRDMLPANSVAVYFAAPVRNRANDVEYVYHQDPDFYYLTGYLEPHAILLVYKEMQTGKDGKEYNEIFFCQERNARAEQWTGKRLGVEGVKEKLGFDYAFNGSEFKSYEAEFGKFEKVLFFDFKNDVRDGGDEADLFSIIEDFKSKAAYPADYDARKEEVYSMIRNSDMSNAASVARTIAYYSRVSPKLANDPNIKNYLKSETEEERKLAIASFPEPEHNLDTYSLNSIMATAREVKTPEEIKLLRKAVDISCIGQAEVMKAMNPDLSETAVQGIHEFVFKKYGAEYEGYPSIVGAGANGCVLHYITNNRMKVGNDLVLMDLGAEYRGYTADVTRTIPANGKFTPEQKAIYDLVYKAQEEAFKICKPGTPIRMTTQVCRKVINEGLAELGLIESADAEHNYFPHGVSHHIGLDVHDKGNYENFEPNMVLTVEPGIYIPLDSPCDKKWWGIGVRIEDDILITETGYELLSDLAPRSSDEIEKLMKKKSALADFMLPELE